MLPKTLVCIIWNKCLLMLCSSRVRKRVSRCRSSCLNGLQDCVPTPTLKYVPYVRWTLRNAVSQVDLLGAVFFICRLSSLNQPSSPFPHTISLLSCSPLPLLLCHFSLPLQLTHGLYSPVAAMAQTNLYSSTIPTMSGEPLHTLPPHG